jgi:hypothetical protein
VAAPFLSASNLYTSNVYASDDLFTSNAYASNVYVGCNLQVRGQNLEPVQAVTYSVVTPQTVTAGTPVRWAYKNNNDALLDADDVLELVAASNGTTFRCSGSNGVFALAVRSYNDSAPYEFWWTLSMNRWPADNWTGAAYTPPTLITASNLGTDIWIGALYKRDAVQVVYRGGATTLDSNLRLIATRMSTFNT